jgi:lipoate-protein ligase A
VWHARELTYAVAAPVQGLGSLRDTHLEIHAMLRDALRALGAAAELAPPQRTAGVDAGACFAAPAGGEVMVRGHKVVGSAQLRQGAALLQHGSVLLDDDQAVVTTVTRGHAAPDGSAPLNRLLDRPATWTDAAEAVVEAAGRRWGRGVRGESPRCVLDRAGFHADRFRSAEWTWSGAA